MSAQLSVPPPSSLWPTTQDKLIWRGLTIADEVLRQLVEWSWSFSRACGGVSMLALSDDTGQSRKNIGYFPRRVNQSNHNKSFVHCGYDSRTFDRCHRAIDSLQCCACHDPFCCQYPYKKIQKKHDSTRQFWNKQWLSDSAAKPKDLTGYTCLRWTFISWPTRCCQAMWSDW